MIMVLDGCLPVGATRATASVPGLSEADFTRLAELILERTGIRLSSSKRLRLETGIRRRAEALGLSGPDAYCRMIFDEAGLEAELDHLVHLSTTNKTDFFREPAHFDVLERRILPEVLASRSVRNASRLKVWSAAASNGAEAYTAAMVLAAAAARGPRFDFAILGTDISTAMVAAATCAIYPESWVAPVPPALRARFVLRAASGASEPQVRIAPELRAHVRFTQLNLIDRCYPVDRDVDVILLRNVLIYFDAPTQKAVVRRLAAHLRPGGYLILGHTEAAIGSAVGLSQTATSVFRVP